MSGIWGDASRGRPPAAEPQGRPRGRGCRRRLPPRRLAGAGRPLVRAGPQGPGVPGAVGAGPGSPGSAEPVPPAGGPAEVLPPGARLATPGSRGCFPKPRTLGSPGLRASP